MKTDVVLMPRTPFLLPCSRDVPTLSLQGLLGAHRPVRWLWEGGRLDGQAGGSHTVPGNSQKCQTRCR